MTDLPTCHPRMQTLSEYEDLVETWAAIHEGGLDQDMAVFRSLVPEFANLSADEIRDAEFTRDDALTLIARQHGFELWSEFRTFVVAFERDGLKKNDPRKNFALAAAAIANADDDALWGLIDADPALLSAQGTGGETLLYRALWSLDHGDWSWLPAPGDDFDGNKFARIEKLVERLVEAQANLHQESFRGWTPLHTAAYIGHVAALQLLLDHDSPLNATAQGDGGTPLVMALFWGQTEAARRIAALDISPPNLRTAAGLGRTDLIDTFVDGSGALSRAATYHVQFYRPHESFPRHASIHSDQQVLDDALIYACRNDQDAVLERLVELGASIDGEVTGATPLTACGAYGSLRCARWLLEHGANPDLTCQLGGSANSTALHLAAWFGHMDLARLLTAKGARYDLRESKWDGSAVNWAKIHGNDEIADYLVALGKLDIRDAIANHKVKRVAELLAEDPAHTKVVDRDGDTPLHYAAYSDERDITRMLLEHGASAAAKNSDGKTPKDAAREGHNPELLEILEGDAGG